MNVRRKILPVLCLMSAYVHWIKPRLLSTSAASKGGKSLLLLLCARSRFLIPMIVFTAFWIFDAQMQIEASVSLTLSRNVRITLGPEGARPDVAEIVVDDEDDEGDGVEEDDETYTIESFSDITSSDEDILLDDVESALREFVDGDAARAQFTFR